MQGASHGTLAPIVDAIEALYRTVNALAVVEAITLGVAIAALVGAAIALQRIRSGR
jgi:hypothetical protein